MFRAVVFREVDCKGLASPVPQVEFFPCGNEVPALCFLLHLSGQRKLLVLGV